MVPVVTRTAEIKRIFESHVIKAISFVFLPRLLRRLINDYTLWAYIVL